MSYPRRWPTAEAFSKAVDEYLAYCKEEQEPITVVGFSVYGKINEDNLHKNYKGVKEFAEVYNRLKTASKHDIVSKALKGDYNATLAKMLLTVNHGMKEEQIVREKVTVTFKGKKF